MSGKFISKIYKTAVGTWGKDAQMKVALEEMAELSKEICKNFRGNKNESAIAEEIADVYIMLDQLCYMFNIDQRVNQEKEHKLTRLAHRLHIEVDEDWR